MCDQKDEKLEEKIKCVQYQTSASVAAVMDQTKQTYVSIIICARLAFKVSTSVEWLKQITPVREGLGLIAASVKLFSMYQLDCCAFLMCDQKDEKLEEKNKTCSISDISISCSSDGPNQTD